MELQPLDWLVLLSCFCAGVGGYRLGLLTRSVSWLGMTIGLVAAFQLLPSVLDDRQSMGPIGRLGVIVLLSLVGALLGQMIGLFLGSRMRRALPGGPIRTADQAAGAGAGIVGVVVALWLLLPTAADIPGWPAHQVRNSRIASSVHNYLPPPPDTVQTLRRFVGDETFPAVFEDLKPAPEVGPPPGAVTLAAHVIDRARTSTVNVEGIACRRTQDGSGFVVAPGLVVTNAHVVAGQRETSVLTTDGRTLDATVVLFDAARDLALLRVPRFEGLALPLAEPETGMTGAVFGHPGGRDEVVVSPAAVRSKIVAVGRDLYDEATTRREVLVLAAALRQGDSGGPLVNDRGEVIGVAFAVAPDRGDTAYALDVSEVRDVLAQPHPNEVSTGPCLNE